MSRPDTESVELHRWKTRAETVDGELCTMIEAFRATGPDHPHHIHQLFAELYLCTTRHWLARLADREDSEYAYRVICHFLQFYKDHVLDRIDHPLDTIAPHWRNYHRMARRQTIRSPISAHLILISVGARAHTHGDLGHAMSLAEKDIAHRCGSGSASLAERQKIFGGIADDAFYHAALDYVALHHARQAGWRRIVLKLYRVGLYTLRPVWLSVFQWWRRTGYGKVVAATARSRTTYWGEDSPQDL